jgi:non-lysosomal glucosylceramidase
MTPAHVPAAAWSRGIGVPYPEAPRKRIDPRLPMIDDGVWGGAPLGGLGAGTIGRTYRGDFARWHLDVGRHHFESLPANQFSVFVKQGGLRQAHVLAPLRPEVLTAWNWDMPVGAGTYHALFPKAWYHYAWDALPVQLTQKQFSPLIPHNYRESSYPVGIFEWTAHNPTDGPLTVGIMLSWQNLLGRFWDARDMDGSNYNAAQGEDGTGVVLARPFDEAAQAWDGTMALAACRESGVDVSYRTRFALDDGAAVWNDFACDGRLDNVDDPTQARARESIAAALAVTFDLAPHETRVAPFALAWDLPVMQFGSGTRWYKRYTRFYGTSGHNAWAIARDALGQYRTWEAAIDAWQQPILDDPARPDWYKCALFNELYFMVDGGTAWENGRVDASTGTARSEYGHFAVLECYDYPFYNTFDVDFYASFARVLLWPELEKGVIRDFAATVPLCDPTPITVEATLQPATRKAAGAVPHDLGGPPEDPWLRVNYYKYQDINIWKDLNSKFVLQVWRDVGLTQDRTLAHDTWPAVVQALDYLRAFDRDGDGLPDHDNAPDQTYDTWTMSGASAYAGSLWLAALEAGIELAKMAGDAAQAGQYREWLAGGKPSFERKLWNGRYYNFDSSGSAHADSIMADQLAGQWYADATWLAPILPADRVRSALRTIFEYNVKRFGSGQMGAVNGMRPDGSVDTSSEQSAEVWPGTNYALAAFMLQRGMSAEAWATAWGVYNVTYNRGFWFRTPEAYDGEGNFRASLYMRPLSVWSMELAIRNVERKKF